MDQYVKSKALLLTALVIFSIQGRTDATACTQDALEDLDLNRCFVEITNQFNWEAFEYEGFVPDCSPYNIIFLHDTSDTVRRSTLRAASDMESLQTAYLQTFFTIFPPDVTNNELAFFVFATKAMEFIELGNYSSYEDFITRASDFRNSAVYNTPFFNARDQGWTHISEGLDLVREVLTQSQRQSKTLLIVMSDGHPERRAGGSVELGISVTAADALRAAVGAENIHIHCLVMRFDDKKGKQFWKNEQLCDSKELITLVSGVTEERLQSKLEFFAARQEFCGTGRPTTSPTTPTPPTVFPTSSPTFLGQTDAPTVETPAPTVQTPAPTSSPTPTDFTTAPTASPTCLQTQNLADVSLFEPLVNNLCGINSAVDPPIIRYQDVFSASGDLPLIDMIIECDPAQNPLYVFVPPDQTFPAGGLTNDPLGPIARIHMMAGVELTVTIKFVDQMENPVIFPGLTLRVYDIDEGNFAKEVFEFCYDDDEYILEHVGENLQHDSTPPCESFTSTEAGNAVPNPNIVPISLLTLEQQAVAVQAHFFQVEEVDITFRVPFPGGTGQNNKRAMFFSISTDSGECIPGETTGN